MDLEFVTLNWHLFLALVVILTLLVFDALRGQMTGVKSISAVELPRLINHDNAVVVDVCESAEFRKGHIPGAINVPMSQLKEGDAKLERHKKSNAPVVVACQSGNRSSKAAAVLRKQEFETVYTLTGGLLAWQKENFPVEK